MNTEPIGISGGFFFDADINVGSKCTVIAQFIRSFVSFRYAIFKAKEVMKNVQSLF